MTIKAPFGTWESPLSPKMMAGNMRLNDVQWDSDGETVVWSERRDGVGRLVAQTGTDAPRELNDSSLPANPRVFYGGGEFAVGGGVVIFSSGGRLYRLPLIQGIPQAITPAYGASAAPALSTDGRWVAYVHSYEDQDRILLVDSHGKQLPHILAEGTDFVMQPVWHPQGTHIAYVAWNHPNMPFNGTELRLVTLAYDKHGTPYNAIEETLVGNATTAILQPQFSPDGRYLAYVSDESGWGHLYLHDLADGKHHAITSGDYEHGTPAWIQGVRVFGWTGDSRGIYFIRAKEGFYSLHRYDLLTQTTQKIEALSDYTYFKQVSGSPKNETVALIGSASRLGTRILTYHATQGVRVVRRATAERLAPVELAEAQAIHWSGHDGETVHGLYYAPTNPAYTGYGLPPLVVLVHGGPTSQRNAEFDDQVQFFATRGYAVLQVNHRGSTGYGKAYMNKHAGQWGVYDVEDSRTGALHLVRQGMVDKDKLIIMGGSAGGYTVLLALIQYPKTFKAGVNLFGVSNLFNLALDTHKFESRYNDWLLGALPDASPIWRERSAVFHAHRIQDALITFQGDQDVVVPPNQSEAIVAILRRNGVPHEYHLYAGEGHGFVQPKTIEDFYTKLSRFLLQYVLFG